MSRPGGQPTDIETIEAAATELEKYADEWAGPDHHRLHALATALRAIAERMR